MFSKLAKQFMPKRKPSYTMDVMPYGWGSMRGGIMPTRGKILRRKPPILVGRTLPIMSPPYRGKVPNIRMSVRDKLSYTKKKAKPKNIEVNIMQLSPNKQKFVRWVKKTHPKLYSRALLNIGTKYSSLGESDGEADVAVADGGFFGNLFSSLTNLAPAYLQFKQQKDLLKMQLKRAQAGLPPANVADYTPVIKTQVDLAPSTRKAFINQTSSLIMPLVIGGGILLAVIAIKKLKKR